MKCKYLISWNVGSDYGNEHKVVVRNFTDNELEEYVNNISYLTPTVQFICVVPEVPLNRRHVM